MIETSGVIEKEQAVPFKRHDGKVGHRKGKGMHSGRYPIKTAAAILKVIESAGNNGENIHIDVENWRIVHIATSRGSSVESRFHRARGRASPNLRETENVEVELDEIDSWLSPRVAEAGPYGPQPDPPSLDQWVSQF